MLLNYLAKILVLSVAFLFIVNGRSVAQDGRHSFSVSLLNSPDKLSYHWIDWTDDSSYKYTEDGMYGVGLGYAFQILPFISAQAKYELAYYNGLEDRDDLRVNINDKYFLVGLKLHPSRKKIKTELNFDYIFTRSSLYYNVAGERRDGNGEGWGAEFGVAIGFQFQEIHSVMVETSGRIIDTYYSRDISDVKNFSGISTIIKMTYEIEF
ncbi:MAG: hypothetical protein JXR11_09260 [Balneola sp.]